MGRGCGLFPFQAGIAGFQAGRLGIAEGSFQVLPGPPGALEACGDDGVDVARVHHGPFVELARMAHDAPDVLREFGELLLAVVDAAAG